MIGIKYGTYDPIYIEYLKTNIVSAEELRRKIYLADWKSQTDQIIAEEVYSVLRRHDFEESLFYLKFYK